MLEIRIDTATTKLRKARVKVQHGHQAVKRHTATIKQIKRKLSTRRARMNRLNLAISKLSGHRKSVAQRKLSALKSQLKNLSLSAQLAKTTVSTAITQLKAARQKARSIQSRINVQKRKVKRLNRQIRRARRNARFALRELQNIGKPGSLAMLKARLTVVKKHKSAQAKKVRKDATSGTRKLAKIKRRDQRALASADKISAAATKAVQGAKVLAKHWARKERKATAKVLKSSTAAYRATRNASKRLAKYADRAHHTRERKERLAAKLRKVNSIISEAEGFVREAKTMSSEAAGQQVKSAIARAAAKTNERSMALKKMNVKIQKAQQAVRQQKGAQPQIMRKLKARQAQVARLNLAISKLSGHRKSVAQRKLSAVKRQLQNLQREKRQLPTALARLTSARKKWKTARTAYSAAQQAETKLTKLTQSGKAAKDVATEVETSKMKDAKIARIALAENLRTATAAMDKAELKLGDMRRQKNKKMKAAMKVVKKYKKQAAVIHARAKAQREVVAKKLREQRTAQRKVKRASSDMGSLKKRERRLRALIARETRAIQRRHDKLLKLQSRIIDGRRLTRGNMKPMPPSKRLQQERKRETTDKKLAHALEQDVKAETRKVARDMRKVGRATARAHRVGGKVNSSAKRDRRAKLAVQSEKRKISRIAKTQKKVTKKVKQQKARGANLRAEKAKADNAKLKARAKGKVALKTLAQDGKSLKAVKKAVAMTKQQRARAQKAVLKDKRKLGSVNASLKKKEEKYALKIKKLNMTEGKMKGKMKSAAAALLKSKARLGKAKGKKRASDKKLQAGINAMKIARKQASAAGKAKGKLQKSFSTAAAAQIKATKRSKAQETALSKLIEQIRIQNKKIKAQTKSLKRAIQRQNALKKMRRGKSTGTLPAAGLNKVMKKMQKKESAVRRASKTVARAKETVAKKSAAVKVASKIARQAKKRVKKATVKREKEANRLKVMTKKVIASTRAKAKAAKQEKKKLLDEKLAQANEKKRAVKRKKEHTKLVLANDKAKVLKAKMKMEHAKLTARKRPTAANKKKLLKMKKGLANARKKLLKKERKIDEDRHQADAKKLKAKRLKKQQQKAKQLKKIQKAKQLKKKQKYAKKANARRRKKSAKQNADTSKSAKHSKKKANLKMKKTVCGDGKLDDGEVCDDGNRSAGDGCSRTCRVETGWSCSAGPGKSVCDKCGNGVVSGQEQCDDGNVLSGDGCDSSCRVERCYTCSKGAHLSKRFSASGRSTCEISATKLQKLTSVVAKKAHRARKKISKPCTSLTGGRVPSNSVRVQQILMDASQLAQPNVNFRTAQNKESCPVKITHGGASSYAYALCESKLVQACVSSGDTLANGGQRQCSFKASAQCKEVCMAPRFCKQRRGVVHGTDLTGASLEKLVQQVKADFPKSATAAERRAKTKALVYKLLHTFDKKGDDNGAISFFEFVHLFHTKPWSVWLRHLLPPHIDQARVASLATGKSQNREVLDVLQEIFDTFDIDGALVKRPKFPNQQACCFRDCSPPRDIIGGHQMRSSLWCFAQALPGGVRLA